MPGRVCSHSGETLARRVGDRTWEANFVAAPVGTLMMAGRWDEALAHVAEAEELATTEFVHGLLLEAVPIHVHRGDLDRVRELLSRSETIARSENASWAASYALNEGLLHAAEGRYEQALAAVDRALALRAQFAGVQSPVRFQALEALAGFADEDKIRELLAVLDELRAAELVPFLRAQQARFRARLPEHDAEAELGRAEELFAQAEMPFHLAVTQLERAEHLLVQDGLDEAAALLEQARERFEELRARPWLDRAEAAAFQGRVPG